ncbi:hypothetical protein [Nocardia sp. NPDC059691]|uniref:hypothetical protein n=1 Tax=Nocardia sp. NPDC059691 TaxID=3346908 RepID=UPI0036AAA71F
MKTTLPLPSHFADRINTIVGLDAQHCVVVDDGSGALVTLTSCCYAYGKGSDNSDSGVVCRACYVEVPVKHAGGGADVAIGRADLDIVIEPRPNSEPPRT